MGSRQEILQSFYDRIDGIGIWRESSISPILGVSPQRCPGFFVFDFKEMVKQDTKIPVRVKAELYIVITFWVQYTLSQGASEKLNDVLTAVQTLFKTNKVDRDGAPGNDGYNLGGLAQLVTEMGSNFYVDDPVQHVASCELTYKVDYIRDHG